MPWQLATETVYTCTGFMSSSDVGAYLLCLIYNAEAQLRAHLAALYNWPCTLLQKLSFSLHTSRECLPYTARGLQGSFGTLLRRPDTAGVICECQAPGHGTQWCWHERSSDSILATLSSKNDVLSAQPGLAANSFKKSWAVLMCKPIRAKHAPAASTC